MRICGKIGNRAANGLRQLVHGDDPSETACDAAHDKHCGCRDRPVAESANKGLKAQVALDDEAVEHGIKHRYLRGLGRCAYAGVNGSKDNDRCKQSPFALPQGFQRHFSIEFPVILQVLAPAHEPTHICQGAGYDQAGYQTSHKQCAHGATGLYSIDDHWVRWRYQYAQGTAGRCDRTSQGLVIMPLDHASDGDATYSNRRSKAGSGQRGKKRAGNNCCYAHAAIHMTDKRIWSWSSPSWLEG